MSNQPGIDASFKKEEKGEKEGYPNMVRVDSADTEKHHDADNFNGESNGDTFVSDEACATKDGAMSE